MMKISNNFYLYEFTRSNKHPEINNDIPTQERNNVVALVENILQPLRDRICKPIAINSGYRCEELNKAVGGVATSQHRRGEAADISVKGMTPKDLAKEITKKYDYDQCIVYPTFVHVSYRRLLENRKQLIFK